MSRRGFTPAPENPTCPGEKEWCLGAGFRRGASTPLKTKPRLEKRGGFTLIELLVVIGILAILATIVVTSLNPAQLLAQARDGRRVAEVDSLNQAVALAVAQSSNLYMGTSTYIYLSLLDANGNGLCDEYLSDLPSLPSGWNYACKGSQGNIQKVDGMGWLPINFTGLSVVPLSNLPIDPVNSSKLGFYYSYTPSWEFDAQMESEAYTFGGSKDVEGKEGGDSVVLYERGIDLTAMPPSANYRVAYEAKVPTTCGDSPPLGFASQYEFYTPWTIPGNGENVAATAIMYYQPDNTLSSSEFLEMAIYDSNSPYAKLSQSVLVGGTGSVGWASTTLPTPISIQLGKTYIFGIASTNVGNNYNLSFDNSPTFCNEYKPNTGNLFYREDYGAGPVTGLNSNAPALNNGAFHPGIIGIKYAR